MLLVESDTLTHNNAVLVTTTVKVKSSGVSTTFITQGSRCISLPSNYSGSITIRIETLRSKISLKTYKRQVAYDNVKVSPLSFESCTNIDRVESTYEIYTFS